MRAKLSAEVRTSIDRLAILSPAELRTEWRRVYRSPSPRFPPDLLRRGIAYRLQERELGGLSKRAVRDLEKTAAALASPKKPKALKVGTRLVRSWHGVTHAVIVLEDGFVFEDKLYGSLSAIAETITGTRWSGPRFFGLKEKKNG